MFKFYFILEYFNLRTCWAQSDVFGVKSDGFSKIRQIRLLRLKENKETLNVTLLYLCDPSTTTLSCTTGDQQYKSTGVTCGDTSHDIMPT